MANKSKQSMARTKQTMEFRTVRSHQSNMFGNNKVSKKGSLGLTQTNNELIRETKSQERRALQQQTRNSTGGAATTLAKKKSANNARNKLFTSISSDERQRSHDRAKQVSANVSNKAGKENAVAKHLSKIYFLNSKQLLKLLSPPREPGLSGASTSMLNQTQQAGMQQGEGELNDEFKTWFQSGRHGATTAVGQTVRSGTVQGQSGRSAGNQRQRNRSSIGVNLSGEIKAADIKDHVSAGASQRQRNHSHSQTRHKKVLTAHAPTQSFNLGPREAPMTVKQRSEETGTHTKQKKMDKLIKSNLKKQKTKTENEQALRELLELQQSQRKTQLTLLNKKVRDANKSKLHQPQMPSQTSQQIRSLSCQRKRQSLSDERQAAEPTAVQPLDRLAFDRKKKDSKVIPFSATHGRTKGFKFNQLSGQPNAQKSSNSPSSNRPKIFDELNLLTRQIEQEINQEGGLTANTTKMLDQGRDSSARNSDLNFYSLKTRKAKELGKSVEYPPTQITQIAAQKGNIHKKKRASVDIQKYIEKQKRRQTIQREREMHIEFDKKLKIQNNLSKLNAFTKRNSKSTIGGFGIGAAAATQGHQRQRSVPAAMNRNGLERSSHNKSMKQKRVKGANKTAGGLRDIFYGATTSASLNQTAGGPTNVQLGSTSDAQQHDYDQYLTAFENSAQVNRSQQRQSKYHKAKKQFSGSGVGGAASKTSHDESGRDTAGPLYLPLKHPQQRAMNSESFPYHERKRSNFNKSQTIQQRQQILVNVPNRSPDGDASLVLASDELPATRNPNATAVSSAENVNTSANRGIITQHQPLPAFEKSISSRAMSELEVESQFASNLPARARARRQGSNKKDRPKTKAQKVEQIRRVAEIVALYRCRFKKGASDASIMGTLHLAASIIQIHFRYQKQLKEARRMKAAYQRKKQESRQLKSGVDPASSSKYIDTEKSRSAQSLISESGQIQPSPLPENPIEESQDIQQNTGVDRPRLDNLASGQIIFNGNNFKNRRPQSVSVSKDQQRNGLGFITDQLNPPQLNNFVEPVGDSNNTSKDHPYHHKKSKLVPDLDFGRLNQDKRKSKQKPVQVEDLDGDRVDDPYSVPGENMDDDQNLESAAKESDARTVSSYSGIFHRIGLPLPRSARVKVEYGLINRDPGLIEQIKNLVTVKQEKGKLALQQGRQLDLISERTYHLNSKKLEKWVAVKHTRLEDMRQENRSRKKVRERTSEELLAEADNDRDRFSRILEGQELERASFASQAREAITGMKSGRSLGRLSYRSQSWRGVAGMQPSQLDNEHDGFDIQNGMPFKYNPTTQVPSNQRSSQKESGEQSHHGEEYTSSEQPRMNNHHLLAPTAQVSQSLKQGSGPDQKQKIVEMIHSKSSRTHSGRPEAGGSSASAEKTENGATAAAAQAAAAVKLNEDEVEKIMRIRETQEHYGAQGGSSQGGHELEERRSLTKSLLSQLDQADEFLPAGATSLAGSSSPAEKTTNLIESQLEQALKEQQREETGVVQPAPSPADIEINDRQPPSPELEDKVEDQIQVNQQFLEQLKAEDAQEAAQNAPAGLQHQGASSTTVPNQNAILVQNQIQDKHEVIEEKSGRKLEIETGSSSALPGAVQPHEGQLSAPNTQQNNVGFSSSQLPQGHPQSTTSPLSDSQAHEIRIMTGAHSLSSTDSDITKVIRAQQEAFDSPPNVLSPQNIGGAHPLLKVVDQATGEAPVSSPESGSPMQPQDPRQQAADDLAGAILGQLVADLYQEIEVIVPRQQAQMHRQSHIRYFEKKGIKTDLCAIEKYVDEMLLQVGGNEDEFTKEIRSRKTKDELAVLFEMQNSEIGTFEHFQSSQPNVLALELYLGLERRRRESRDSGAPDSRFDFENVTDADLIEDRVDRNFLAECQYIHNKVLFDCINDSLQQFRPYGKDGEPPTWSRLARKLRPTEDFTLVEMFEVAKHDLFRMAIMQAGTLPRREFVFGGQFDEELFTELREKKLAALLCREIVDSEPQWLKWDFEEAQTKIDLSDMVLEHLVTETIEVLGANANKRAQLK